VLVHPAARHVARKLMPNLAASRAISYERQFRAARGVPKVARKVSATLGRSVAAGPFSGLLLPEDFEESIASPVAKLAGVYEHQLQDALEQVIATGPICVANVGCADGYYAVGLALRLPGAEVLAYDIAKEARVMTSRLAQQNGVASRVHVFGRCRAFKSQTQLIVCDIEGGEDALLNPSRVPSRSALLVETHDHVVPGVTADLIRRFAPTHDVNVIHHGSSAVPPSLEWLSAEELAIAMDEMRGQADQSWLVMTPQPYNRETAGK